MTGARQIKLLSVRTTSPGSASPRRATVPLDVIGGELCLAKLYERVDFAAAAREADEEADEWGFPR